MILKFNMNSLHPFLWLVFINIWNYCLCGVVYSESEVQRDILKEIFQDYNSDAQPYTEIAPGDWKLYVDISFYLYRLESLVRILATL